MRVWKLTRRTKTPSQVWIEDQCRSLIGYETKTVYYCSTKLVSNVSHEKQDFWCLKDWHLEFLKPGSTWLLKSGTQRSGAVISRNGAFKNKSVNSIFIIFFISALRIFVISLHMISIHMHTFDIPCTSLFSSRWVCSGEHHKFPSVQSQVRFPFSDRVGFDTTRSQSSTPLYKKQRNFRKFVAARLVRLLTRSLWGFPKPNSMMTFVWFRVGLKNSTQIFTMNEVKQTTLRYVCHTHSDAFEVHRYGKQTWITANGDLCLGKCWTITQSWMRKSTLNSFQQETWNIYTRHLKWSKRRVRGGRSCKFKMITLKCRFTAGDDGLVIKPNYDTKLFPVEL